MDSLRLIDPTRVTISMEPKDWELFCKTVRGLLDGSTILDNRGLHLVKSVVSTEWDQRK